MNKWILVFLVLGVLAISGCTQNVKTSTQSEIESTEVFVPQDEDILKWVSVKSFQAPDAFGPPQSTGYVNLAVFFIGEPLTSSPQIQIWQILFPDACTTLSKECKDVLKAEFLSGEATEFNITGEKDLIVDGRSAYEIEVNFTEDGVERKQKVVNIKGTNWDHQVVFLADVDIYDQYVASVDSAIATMEFI